MLLSLSLQTCHSCVTSTSPKLAKLLAGIFFYICYFTERDNKKEIPCHFFFFLSWEFIKFYVTWISNWKNHSSLKKTIVFPLIHSCFFFLSQIVFKYHLCLESSCLQLFLPIWQFFSLINLSWTFGLFSSVRGFDTHQVVYMFTSYSLFF